jgi:hypothetical protein
MQAVLIAMAGAIVPMDVHGLNSTRRSSPAKTSLRRENTFG